MGKLVLIVVTGTMLVHAGMRERAHESYLAGHYAEAAEQYRQVLAGFGEVQSLARAVAMENLGVALREAGQVDEARPLMERAALEISELNGIQSAEAVQARSNLAALYWSSGDREKAGRLFRELLPVATGERKIRYYGNLASVSVAAGDIPAAEDYARRGVELASQILGPDHPLRATVLNNLAQAERFAGKYLEAESGYREALGIWERSVGRTHPDYAKGLMNLASFYHERGRDAGAEQLYLEAAEILAKNEPELAVVARNELADVLRAELRYTEASKLARSTLARMEATMPSDDPRLARARYNWARLTAETSHRKTLRAAR